MTAKKKKTKKIKPEILKGFRDYPPSEEIHRQKLISTIRTVFESFGFSPLQTPALERVEVLKGSDYGEENLASIFSFEGPEDVHMALRFEHTASLARFVAGNPELPLPFRRYQCGTVWRVDKPGPGRFREFTQFDIDSVGTSSMLADAEIIAAICRSFEALGLPNYRVRYSTRKFLNGMARQFGISEDVAPDVFRVIDKFEKVGLEEVRKELGSGRIDESGDKIRGVNLPESQIDAVSAFLDDYKVAPGQDWHNTLEVAKKFFSNNTLCMEGIEELRQINNYLEDFRIPLEKTQVDLTIVRGLGYYTGPVYETFLDDLPELGSVFAGGRYDGLVERFLGKSIPATGASAGIDRLLAGLMGKNALGNESTVSRVLVTAMDRELSSEYLKLLNEIRDCGIPAEIFLGETRNLTKQLRYADRVGIPVAVIIGSEEYKADQVTVKNLVAGREKAHGVSDRETWLKAEQIQETIDRKELIPYLKRLLTEHSTT